MSDYSRITRHPNDGRYDIATWHDNYFGHGLYGVRFPNDEVVYPASQVEQAQIATFWVADVLETLRERGWDDETIVRFLEKLQETYKRRWQRDPIHGEGAVEWYRSVRLGLLNPGTLQEPGHDVDEDDR